MKIFKNKFLVKLIATICLFLTLLNFCGANKVYAEDAGWGGVLISPIVHLMTALGDTVMELLHKAVKSQNAAIIHIEDAGWFEKVKEGMLIAVAATLAAVAFIGLSIATAGAINALLGAIAGGVAATTITISAGTIIGGVALGVCVGVAVKGAVMSDDIYLPAFSITAEEIFANRLHLFDVNFFNPMKDEEVGQEEVYNPVVEYEVRGYVTSDGYPGNATYELFTSKRGMTLTYSRKISSEAFNSAAHELGQYAAGSDNSTSIAHLRDKTYGSIPMKSIIGSVSNIDSENRWNDSSIVFYTDAYATEPEDTTCPEGIVCNGVDIVIVDHNENKYYIITFISTDDVEIDLKPIVAVSTAKQLREIVSTWYYILRNIALLVLMLVLIYTGIRIVIGSTAGEKAKYKERLTDWLVAMCLVMIMHYIMVFAVNIVEKLTELIATTTSSNVAFIQLKDDAQYEKAKEVLAYFNTIGDMSETGGAAEGAIYTEGGQHYIYWPTDLAGSFRIQGELEKEGTANWIGYSLCYVVLVLFTFFFAFTYLKRIVYMAFLTMIAPLVAMTYPIDKMTDGQAQAFNSWLKEYIFNLMIQPLHLLLYTILVTSAFELASENPVYALVALGFMIPAEKLVRKFFGFEKATTPGLLGGAAGAALAMTGLQNLLKPKSHGKGEGGHIGKEQAQGQNKVKISGANKTDAMDAIVAGGLPDTKKQHNPKLSRGQKEELEGIGINPEHNEYNDWVKDYYGINPNENTLNVPQGTNTNSSSQAPSKSNVKAPKDHQRHILRAVGRASLGAGKKLAVGALTGIHPLRMAGKIATGAVGATAGLLIGTASGDVGKAFQYATTGGLAGAKLASSLSGGKNLLTDDYIEDVKQSYYGEDYAKVYQEKMREKQVKQLKSAENINYLMRNMSVDRAQAKNILETTGERCVTNEGITDLDDIATIHKLTEANAMSFEKAVAARNYAKTRLGGSDINSMTTDNRKKHLDTWAKEYKDKYNLTDYEAQAWAEQTMNAAIRFNDTKASLK